jgi:hypothetical protein
VVHRPRGGGARSGDQVSFPSSRLKSGGGTAPRVAVYTEHTGATLLSPASLPRLGGHCPRGGGATGQGGDAPPKHLPLGLAQSVTAIGVAVHRTEGCGSPRAAPRAKFRLLFFTYFTTFANVLTLQVFHHHVQVC